MTMIIMIGFIVVGTVLCVWSTSLAVLAFAALDQAKLYVVPRAGYTLSELFVLPKRVLRGVLKGKTTTKGIPAVSTLVAARFANVRLVPSSSVTFTAMRKLDRRWTARMLSVNPANGRLRRAGAA